MSPGVPGVPRVRRPRLFRRPAGALALLLPALAVAVASPAAAQDNVFAWEGGGLELGGYLRSLTALHDAAVVPPGEDGTGVFAGQVLRLAWNLRGDGWHLEVHDRLQGRVTSRPGGRGSVVGFGVSAVPGRSVDLETDLAEGEQYRVWHDLDRLAFTVQAGPADVTVGRQAITWGLGSLFPVADLWTRFSPFELDTEHKPGIDAVRVLVYPVPGLEVDGVMADRGSLEDLSAGVRANWTLSFGDLYLAGGKFWREGLVAMGGTLLLDEVRFRAEGVLPWGGLDDAVGEVGELGGVGGGDGGEAGPAGAESGLQDPRVTLGAEWITGEWIVGGELHFNGIGAGEPERYVAVAADPRFARGETYYLGRWYAGGLVSHIVTDRLSLAGTLLVNVQDPSAALTPSVTYDVGQSARISMGGLLSAGEQPFLTPARSDAFGVQSRSEFGSYGQLAWTQLSVYF